MLPKINFSELRVKDIEKFGESTEVMADSESLGIFIKPNTDYILDQAKALAELSNTVLPDPTRFDVIEPVEPINITESQDSLTLPIESETMEV